MPSKVTSITQGKQGRFAVSRSQQLIISRRKLFITALIAAGGSQIVAARRADVPIGAAKLWTRDMALGLDPRKAA
jgi:hypothetical protein